ncbi:hypothetical protein [Cohnella fermenti]|uniref:Uncharacterized protein n=1 Tax=Cohnella fermenti TaxID=2565925 RepID=A0A4S4BMQ6_9BACL|nr:hypothetical protein [Cohnella fermenti]THF76035.1 hypothetical protein E6C55_19845 [Cohnella fermenti]
MGVIWRCVYRNGAAAAGVPGASGVPNVGGSSFADVRPGRLIRASLADAHFSRSFRGRLLRCCGVAALGGHRRKLAASAAGVRANRPARVDNCPISVC